MDDMTMSRLAAFLLPTLLALGPGLACAQLFKCDIEGVVSYQGRPCPSSAPRQQPSVERLNAERKARAAKAAGAAPAPSEAPAGGWPATRPAKGSPGQASFACDHRKHCSQMRSCAEANYFLAHCPGVKMDGDNDGIPCEEQWCNR
jgi:hypothetical protein